ncbi:Terminase-like family protein [Roseivivax sp. THAF40]|uniref:phage terminase large subunit n=1 Tax=Roseivivax sp. THAF40 TaxID=2587858 RepID=UPI001267D53C|nr:phage terminase large subunit [Roseivivax sp. THAF40]QFT47413.1 Terminase-like family protein [Roseivivax sp. THAF40]
MMTATTLDDRKALADAAMRENLYAFLVGAFPILCPGETLARAPYLEAMCYALQRVAAGSTQRSMISIAPRHLKSICGSVLLPAFVLGRDPTQKIVVVSYGKDLAREHAELFRRLVTSEFYRRLFPRVRIDQKHNRFEHTKTTSGGGRKSVSLGGGVTGFGANLIIIDDLGKPSEMRHDSYRQELRDYFDQTLFSRLNDKRRDRIVSIQQRLHPDDFSAYLLEKDTFEHLCLPSVAETPAQIPLYNNRLWNRVPGDLLNPEREPQDVLDRIKADIGSFAFQAQYQQNPADGESAFLSMADLHLVDTLPDEAEFVRRVQSWDTAAKDGPRCDFSVGLTFGWHGKEERWYLVDVIRRRIDYTELKATILRERKRWRADKVLIEASAMGVALLQEFRRQASGVYQPINVVDSKLDRFIPHTDWIKSGQLVIPTDQPWFDAFRRELLAFPDAAYDDQVDALTQFAEFMRRSKNAYLDTDPVSGRRLGKIRRKLPRREDRMKFE